MAWHAGTWWPLIVKEWYPPRASHHVFDPYSFCLVVLGLVFHLLWGTDEIDHWVYGFLLALGLELVWKMVENTGVVVKRIRENNGAAGDYTGIVILSRKIMHVHIPGDSIQNILGDLFSCGLGYILGTLFAALEVWWLSLVWILVSEVEYNVKTCFSFPLFFPL